MNHKIRSYICWSFFQFVFCLPWAIAFGVDMAEADSDQCHPTVWTWAAITKWCHILLSVFVVLFTPLSIWMYKLNPDPNIAEIQSPFALGCLKLLATVFLFIGYFALLFSRMSKSTQCESLEGIIKAYLIINGILMLAVAFTYILCCAMCRKVLENFVKDDYYQEKLPNSKEYEKIDTNVDSRSYS